MHGPAASCEKLDDTSALVAVNVTARLTTPEPPPIELKYSMTIGCKPAAIVAVLLTVPAPW